jgi:hypothetical protein
MEISFFFLHGLADERAEMISMDRMGQLLDAVTWLAASKILSAGRPKEEKTDFWVGRWSR